MIKARQFFKQHVFLLFCSGTCLSSLFFIGFTLSQSSHLTDTLARIPDKNSEGFIVWRAIFYLSLFILWKPFCLAVFKRKNKNTNTAQFRLLLTFKYRLLVMSVLYELVFVQNIIRFLLGG